MNKKGIDISSWQGYLTKSDFEKIKASGIDFIMARCGYTGFGVSKQKNVDKYFENNYKLAKEVGLPIGVYYYSCATSTKEGKEEAEFVLNIVKDKMLEYPVFIDTEDNHDITDSTNAKTSQASIGKIALTSVISTFCEAIEDSGYYVGIYASQSWFQNNLVLSDLDKYDKWVAKWSNTEPGISYGMWQYSSTGTVSGVSGNVDLDYAILDYETIIKENGLNNYTKTVTPETSKEKESLIEEFEDEVEEILKKDFLTILKEIKSKIVTVFKNMLDID